MRKTISVTSGFSITDIIHTFLALISTEQAARFSDAMQLARQNHLSIYLLYNPVLAQGVESTFLKLAAEGNPEIITLATVFPPRY
jgi:hypothetical protein